MMLKIEKKNLDIRRLLEDFYKIKYILIESTWRFQFLVEFQNFVYGQFWAVLSNLGKFCCIGSGW